MAHHTHDDISFCGAGDGDFIAIFILFMVFPFADTVSSGLVQGIDLVFVLRLLIQYAFLK